ncbi:hypothetical protein MKX47_08865 [Solibacillus sp. FSL R7-0668]|uniref:hypothetical protein n=1 Tax=Solibacillus sp. FSL R7-0668 TaxID=2921688 RepID=UPI0030F75C4A
MLLLWNLAFCVSIFTLIMGLVKQSWRLLLISSIPTLPIALYFLMGAENAFKYVGFSPLLLLILTAAMWVMNKRKMKFN